VTNEPANEAESREEEKKKKKKRKKREKRERASSLLCPRNASILPLLFILAFVSEAPSPALPALPLKFPPYFPLFLLFVPSASLALPSPRPGPIRPIPDRPSVPVASFSVLANNNAFVAW
jgi:hypothetical protein